MSELNASLYSLQNTQSIAFKFFSESVKEIERQIHSTAGLNFFTTEQIDFIVLICDQFQKLVKLRSKSKLIDNLLAFNFPEFFQAAEKSDFPSTAEPARSEAIEPVKKSENPFSFVCDICDEDVPILNNDINFSTQSHLSSPYHLEVVSVLRKIKESETSASSVAGSLKSAPAQNGPSVVSAPKNASDGNKFASRVVVSNAKTIRPSKPVSGTISAEEESFQRFAWIQAQRQSQFLLWRHSQYYCCLCDAYLPTQHNFDAHVRTFAHKTNVQAERNIAAAKETSRMGSTCSDEQSESRVAAPASTSDRQSSQIIVVVNGVRVCTLCNVRLPSEANFVSHVGSVTHRKKSEIFSRTFDALTKALNNVTNSAASTSSRSATTYVNSKAANKTSDAPSNFLVTRNGTQCCSLCNVQVPGKAQQDSHFNGSLHMEQLQTTFKKPTSKSFTDFIVIKGAKRYCILCNINLPGESQLTGHKYGKTHRQKMKEYEEKYLS